MQIIIIGGLLLLYGLFAIYSVSIYESFNISLKLVQNGVLQEPSNYFYFFRQIKNLVIGLIFAFFVYKIHLGKLEKYKNKIIIFALIFQLLVFTPLGTEFNGAKGWLYFKGVGTIQPSEFFKLAFVIFFAGWLVKKKQFLSTLKGFFAFLFVTGIFFAVFLKIPDLGTILVLGLVSLIMYWHAGGKMKYIIFLFIAGLFAGLTIGMQFDYIKKRLENFVNPQSDETGRGVGWQITQALTAVGGGGIIGNGYGKGLQKFGYIPEAQSDFIFAAFSEEVGFFGNLILLSLYFLLAYFFIIKLKNIKNEYYKMLGVGVISLIIVQAFINIGVNIKIVPLTGLTLPFVSFGGTALMINLFELVILYKISQNMY